jgi:hypothetical protein
MVSEVHISNETRLISPPAGLTVMTVYVARCRTWALIAGRSQEIAISKQVTALQEN